VVPAVAGSNPVCHPFLAGGRQRVDLLPWPLSIRAVILSLLTESISRVAEVEQVDEGKALVEALREAGDETTRVVAVLWTWLERHLLELGSLREKLPGIRISVNEENRPFEGLSGGLLEWVDEAPLRNGAALLARIDLTYGKPSQGLMAFSEGFEGEEVLVAWRRTDLVRKTSEHDHPPSADEYPSLTTLAPSLLVCPVLAGGIRLRPRSLERPEGELVRNALEDAMRGVSPPLEVHLDSLGTSGLPVKWDIDNRFGLAALIEGMEEEGKPAESEQAVRGAVRAAAGSARILVLPELVASEATLAAIRDELIEMDGEGPALTVLGLYHRAGTETEEDSDLLKGEALGHYVNEAVVLGPFGEMLWDHRKFTSAGETVESEDGDRYVVEDIRLGRHLTVVDTPLGIIAVPICLDTFAAHGRERLERSPANILLVPSLSRNVKRHRASLGLLVQVLWGLAFVCNRWLIWEQGETNWNGPDNRSFWAIQRSTVEEEPTESPGDRPSFVYSP
jgi:hypothetical protein